MKVALYARAVKEQHKASVSSLIRTLTERCDDIFLFERLHESLRDQEWLKRVHILRQGELKADTVHYLLTLGGDGSFLDGVALVGKLGIPLVGVNCGRIGFLADVSIDESDKIVSRIFSKKTLIQKRSLLGLTSDNSDAILCFDGNTYALNEITLSKKDTSTLLAFRMYIDNKLIHTYWSDGIIISTPTGSTGYSLSCNGPIAFPDTACFVITPIASHNLNIRPLIVPDSVSLSFKIDSRSGASFICTLDARRKEIHSACTLTISKSPFKLNVLKIDGYHFVDALREKLHWGKDSRNY